MTEKCSGGEVVASMEPSKYQRAIYEWVERGQGSAVVEAVAGSGKTSTCVEAANILARNGTADGEVLFLAFNKAIADELNDRLPPMVDARTFHSVGMEAWKDHYSGVMKVDNEKVRRLIRGVMEEEPEKSGAWWALARAQGAARRLVGLAQAVGLVPEESTGHAKFGLVADSEDVWLSLLEHYDIQCDDPGTVVELARRVLAASIAEAVDIGVVCFDDMVYLPVVCRARLKTYRWVFVDEAQDVSELQRRMLHALAPPGGRLVAVGDPRQAIYGWRGAGSDAITRIAQEFKCARLPLSISYRCPRSVVAEAQRFVPQMEVWEKAEEGKVECRSSWKAADLAPGDVVLCRNVAPLLETCFRLIRAGVPCWMRGRDIGSGLVTLVKRMRAGNSVDVLRTKLEIFLQKETKRLLKDGKEAQVDALTDRVESLFAVADHAGVETVEQLVERIEGLFQDGGRGVELCTVHRAKGLEWDRVWLLDRASRMPSRWARRPWQREQEVNLIYVAVTRARKELVDVTLEGWVG